MRHLNYNHLLYFNAVAREGSIAHAAETLHITPQTISGQIKLLEESIGTPLFDRVGRGLVLTETGQAVNRYAEEIFSLGSELSQWVSRQAEGPYTKLIVGIVNSIPTLIAHELLRSVLELEPRVKMVCKEDTMQVLLADLAVHRLDLVLSDQKVPAGLSVRAFNHLLGKSPISFYGARKLAEQYAPGFPQTLEGAPLLFPMPGSALRGSLDAWFENIGITPNIIAEFDDSALLKAFGESGSGIFPAPGAIEQQLQDTYHAHLVGHAGTIKESYYAISPERVLKQPAILHITESARLRLSSLN